MFYYPNHNTKVSHAAPLAARIHPWRIFVQSFMAVQQIFVERARESARESERERERNISIHIRT